jgi:hypothetical protein
MGRNLSKGGKEMHESWIWLYGFLFLCALILATLAGWYLRKGKKIALLGLIVAGVLLWPSWLCGKYHYLGQPAPAAMLQPGREYYVRSSMPFVPAYPVWWVGPGSAVFLEGEDRIIFMGWVPPSPFTVIKGERKKSLYYPTLENADGRNIYIPMEYDEYHRQLREVLGTVRWEYY